MEDFRHDCIGDPCPECGVEAFYPVKLSDGTVTRWACSACGHTGQRPEDES